MFSTATANTLLGTLTTLDVALFTVLPNAAGTGGTELTGVGGYTRIAATMGAASAGKRTSTADVLFPVATGTQTGIVGWGFYDALTSGNFIFAEYLSAAEPLPFTAATSGTVTAPAHGMVNTDRVVLEAGEVGVLPTGLTATTVYFVISAATDTFQVSTTSGGGAVTITAAGSGLYRKVDVKTINTGEQFKITSGSLTLAIR
jgi:hypothetical protein